MKKDKIPSELIELITEEEIILFKDLQKRIQELNYRTNLTRLIDGDNYWISQVFDSIWPFKILPNLNFDNKKFLDIGSGCGFPGFAYAITHPSSEIYLVDSSKKKTDALKSCINQVNFKNKFYVINDRIENLAHESKLRNTFDVVTARAVSNPYTVSEYILPLLNKGGLGVLFCGKWDNKENKSLLKTLEILDGKLIDIKNTSLPNNKGTRNIIFIKPKKYCSAVYPRSVGKPEKYPLKD